MNNSTIKPGAILAEELLKQSEQDAAITPMDAILHHMYEALERECTGCADCLHYCPEPGALLQY